MLILINFYTIKTLSAARAYVNGESHYSKGQHIATRNLINYLFTADKAYWVKFNKSLSVPLGDYKARLALNNHSDIEIVKQGFREGMNEEEDLEDMVWLFENFQNLSFFKAAIKEWKGGDILNLELLQLGIELEPKIEKNQLTFEDKIKILHKLDKQNIEISIKEANFSNLMGEGTRTVKYYLLLTNFFFICIIITSISIYYSSLLKKIIISKKLLGRQKSQLKKTVRDLEKTKKSLSTQIVQHEKIIGTISHDIRSPLKYIHITADRLSKNVGDKLDSTSHKYVDSILKSSSQLYDFTKSLVEYSKIYIEEKNFKQKNSYSVYDLIEEQKNIYGEIAKSNNTILINQAQHNLYSKINVKIISIILHNLLDNSLKFTNYGSIEIGAELKKDKLIYWVSDTGVGMSEDVVDYYMDLARKRDLEKLVLSTYGIGLHLVIELLNILKAKIEIDSTLNVGTKITIEICLNENK